MSPESLEEIRQAVQEVLTPEFAAIHASFDRLERAMDRNYLAIMARLDRLSPTAKSDSSAPWQTGSMAGVDPRLMERLLAIEHELAAWRKAGS